MVALILDWLNAGALGERAASAGVVVTDLEDDFANGYLLGVLLEALGYWTSAGAAGAAFEDVFADEDGTLAARSNFAAAAQALDKAALAAVLSKKDASNIRSRKHGAMAKVLLRLKRHLDGCPAELGRAEAAQLAAKEITKTQRPKVFVRESVTAWGGDDFIKKMVDKVSYYSTTLLPLLLLLLLYYYYCHSTTTPTPTATATLLLLPLLLLLLYYFYSPTNQLTNPPPLQVGGDNWNILDGEIHLRRFHDTQRANERAQQLREEAVEAEKLEVRTKRHDEEMARARERTQFMTAWMDEG
jgi:hypothetical protein